MSEFLSPWLRIIVTQVRVDPERVIFVNFDHSFERLAESSHPLLCKTHFTTRNHINHIRKRFPSGLTIIERSTEGIVLWSVQAPNRTRSQPVDIIKVSSETFLCDLIFLLALAEKEGQWQSPDETRAQRTYQWNWLWGSERRFHRGVYRVYRCGVLRSDFIGEVMESNAPINHQFPKGFLTLGSNPQMYEKRRFVGGVLNLTFPIPRVQSIRRAFLRVIWPPFHRRGLVASKPSQKRSVQNDKSFHMPDKEFVGLRVYQKIDLKTRYTLAEVPCHTPGDNGCYYPQDYTRNELCVLLSEIHNNSSNKLNLELSLTPHACLDIYRLSLHMFIPYT